MGSRRSIAIVGTGVAGLGCAHRLHARHDLTLFEAGAHVGGHVNTVTVHDGEREVPLDTGFMVFNHATYPNLTRLFAELGVATMPTSMSFSVQHRPSGLEYNGSSLSQLFGQRRTLVSARHWRLLLAIARFNREAPSAIDDPRWADLTLGDYVHARGYGDDLLERYLVPMAGAVWSTPPDRMLDFPATTLLTFWRNHGFLGLTTQHQWYTVVGGARSYVERISAPFASRIRLRTPVRRVTRDAAGVTIRTDRGEERYDAVILACHADQALALLGDPSPREQALLSPFRYQANPTVVHTDAGCMPRTRRCWASWNYRAGAPDDAAPGATVHYWMNSLQRVSTRRDFFVTLNGEAMVDPSRVLHRIAYDHPLFDRAAIRAQRELPALNVNGGGRHTYYAGAWFRYGFHEDGLASAIACARAVTDTAAAARAA